MTTNRAAHTDHSRDTFGVYAHCAYCEAADEFNAEVPDWEARLADHDGIANGTLLAPGDLDDYLAPVESNGVPMADFDAYLAMCYVDPAERVF